MAVRLSALRAGRPLPPGRFLMLLSITDWVDPRTIVQLEGLGKLEKKNRPIGTRTRDLVACRIVPQPTTLLCAPARSAEIHAKSFALWRTIFMISLRDQWTVANPVLCSCSYGLITSSALLQWDIAPYLEKKLVGSCSRLWKNGTLIAFHTSFHPCNLESRSLTWFVDRSNSCTR
jgi:hypothetical protein